jgi:hypothetical protein
MMADLDSLNDADDRPTSRPGGAPWPPPGADAWWTQDGGTRAAQHPTPAAPSERSAPDIPAPSTASEAAADPPPTVDPSPVDDLIETPTARVTRRRTPRPAGRDSDRPAGSRRRRPAASDGAPAGPQSVEQQPTPTDEAIASVPTAPTAPTAADRDDGRGIATTMPVTNPETEPMPSDPMGASPDGQMTTTSEMIDEVATGTADREPSAIADESIAAKGAADPQSATIIADGDFVEEPEFAVPDMQAPPSTRRNAPDTGFPIRVAAPTRPPARREPVPALSPPPLPASRRPQPAPAPGPIQPPAHGDMLDNFFDGDRAATGLAPGRRGQPGRTGRPHRHRKPPRRPAFGLPLLLVFALAAAFFAWVSATPLLLTAGHGARGVATVATCSVHGLDRSCAEFVAADKSFSAAVTLLGPASNHAKAGQKIDAQMVSRGSSLAYAGNNADLLLHWIPGVVLIVLCGFGIAWATGAFRLADRRTRSLALLGSFGGPTLLFVGMLAYAW